MDGGPRVVGVEEGWIEPEEGRVSVTDMAEPEENQSLSGAGGCLSLFVEVLFEEDLLPLLTLDLLSCLRPPRLVATYSQTRPRLAHREQVGFSL